MQRLFQKPHMYLMLCIFLCPLSLKAESRILDLDDSIRIALQYNPQVEIARQQFAGSQAVLTQAKSLYWPHLTAGGEYGRYQLDGLQPVDEDNVGTLLLSVSQLIYDFGRTTGLIDASAYSMAGAKDNLKQGYQDVAFNVKTSYYSVLEKKELIQVAKEAVQNYEQQLYRAQKYLKAGVRTRIDVTNAEVNLSRERLGLLKAQADYKTARVQFEEILGQRPNNGDYELQNLVDDLGALITSKPPMPGPLDTLLQNADENRPGLHRLDKLIKAAEATLEQAGGDYWPAISATGSYTEYETDIISLYDQWQVGVGLSWELFSGFETEGKVAEAKAGLREVKASFRQYDLSVVQEVTDSYHRADEARESVDIAGQTLDLAAENLQLAEKRYQNGLGDLLEFNDAQLLHTSNQTNLVAAYYNYLRSLARIERATGMIPELADSDYQ